MTTPLILNDVAYRDRRTDSLDALRQVIVFSVDDWGGSRALAWVWGIVCGWDNDDEGNPGVPELDAMAELAERFGWSADDVEHLRVLHRDFVAKAAK